MSLTVIVKNNNVEKAIRQLKKKLLKEGVMKELKQRQLQKELEKRNFFRIFRHINN